MNVRVGTRLIAFLVTASLSPHTLKAQQAPSRQTPVLATSAAGRDIGDRINHALKDCALQCTVYIPAGKYSFATTIELELNPFGKYKLSGDPGAVLTYTGHGDAITTTIGIQPGASQLIIEGFQLAALGGKSGVAAGIHLMPTNRITVRNMVITGFSDGILVEGTNSSNIYDNLISSNKNGIRLIPTVCSTSRPIHCGTSVEGYPYAANAIHVTGNQITNNSQWAIFEDTVLVGHGLTEALNNLYMGNNLEGNAGAIYLTRSRGTVISANYFEGSGREVVLGMPNGGSGYRAYGPVVRDNYFTTTMYTPYNIEIQDADSALIEGNSELVATIGPKNCFVNVISSTRAWISKNAIYQKNAYCFNGVPGIPPSGDGFFFDQR